MNESTSSSPAAVPPVAPHIAWIGILVGWMIPGAGFMICGRWRRGLAQFVIVMLTFTLGIALHSGVAWPEWSPRREEFNLINNFTFIVQMGSGFPALASLMASLPHGAENGSWAWLAGIQKHPYYELGSYFLIVAGAVNFFALGNLYDRVIQPHPRFQEQEFAEKDGPS